MDTTALATGTNTNNNNNNNDGTNTNVKGSQQKDEITTDKKSEIRVYKKSSLNGKITVYLGKRDFVDHIAYVDPIDGVILIDRDYVKDKKVFSHVLATFSYGRDDLDVLGLTFRKELYLVNEQIYPDTTRRHYSKQCPYYIEGVSDTMPIECDEALPADNTNSKQNHGHSQSSSTPQQNQHYHNQQHHNAHQHHPQYRKPQRPLTRLQERLVKKLGPNAFPFFFELPPLCPASVTLQPGPGDSGKPCGVDYELKAYIASSPDEKPPKRDSIRLAIRKIMYAPSKQGEQPMVEVSKDFMMSPNKLNLEVSLDKELYYHGESIAVNVHISNNSNRTVKKVKVSVRQFADICLFSTAQYKCTVAEIESEEGCPVGPGATLSKVYNLTPLLAFNKDKRGLALDGQLKHEDTNLASSTLMTDSSQKENLGIVVQYKVRVKLALGPLGGDISAELPVTLMHPKPEGEDDLLISKSSPIGLNLGEGSRQRRGSTSRNPLESIFGKTMACKCDVAITSSSTKLSSQQQQQQPITTETTFDNHKRTSAGGNGTSTNSNDNALDFETNNNSSNQQLLLDEQDLIQLDDDNDDIIFEDFARMRLDHTTNELSSSQKSYEEQQLHQQQLQHHQELFQQQSGDEQQPFGCGGGSSSSSSTTDQTKELFTQNSIIINQNNNDNKNNNNNSNNNGNNSNQHSERFNPTASSS